MSTIDFRALALQYLLLKLYQARAYPLSVRQAAPSAKPKTKVAVKTASASAAPAERARGGEAVVVR